MFKISRSSSHNALDPRSWDSKVNWRTCDIGIDCGAKRFPRLRYAWWDDCVCIEKTSRPSCSLPQKSKCRREACSKIQPILTRETNCLHDLQALPCNRSLWSGTRTLRFVQYTFAERRRPRLRRSMGSSSVISKRNSYGNDPGRIVQVNIAGFFSASDCIGCVRSRNRSNQRADKLFTIEDVCKTSYWSDDDNSKLQRTERSCGKRSGHPESKRKESLRWEESGRELSVGRHMDNIQKETHVISVMTDWYKETCTVVRDEKDDRLLPHQIRRPRLTEEKKILQKNIRQQRGKLFRQGTTFHAVTKIVKTPSCKFWHPPVCQDYKSGTGCKYGRTCFFRHVEAEEKPNKKPKKGGAKGSVALLKESTPLVCVEGKLGSKHAVNFSKGTWHQIREELSNSVNLMNVVLARQNLGKVTWVDLASRKMRPWRKYFMLKSAGNATFLLLLNKGNAGIHIERIRETIIRSRFRSIIAHDEQKKESSSDELDTSRRSRNPLWCLPQMEKCIQTRKHKFSFTI